MSLPKFVLYQECVVMDQKQPSSAAMAKILCLSLELDSYADDIMF